MNRHGKPLASVFVAALLLSGAAAGCSRSGGPNVAATFAPSSPAAATMAAQPSRAEIAETPSAVDTAPANPSPSASPSPIDSSTASSMPVAANPTTDPLDGDLQSVNQLLNGIDSSISGSNAGGE